MSFDLTEAKNLVAFCADLEGLTPPLNPPPLPPGWNSVFISPVMGDFENKWQLWANTAKNQYAVVIRGTVSQTGSIFEDVMAVMIPASGTLPLGSVSLPYKLAEDPKASVHLGFTLGMAILLFDRTNGILTQLQQVPEEAEIFIAGHSQGAAIATLCRSFLQYSDMPFLKAKRFTYKTYLYAQPKPGNDHYGLDFERLVSNVPAGFRITNSQDWVPQVPLALQGLGSLNTPNLLSVFVKFKLGSAIAKKLLRICQFLFQRYLAHVHKAKHRKKREELEQVLKTQTLQTTMTTTELDLPIVPTLNFVNCGTAITLTGTSGDNPNDPKDFFWQHHAAMYYDLLCTWFP